MEEPSILRSRFLNLWRPVLLLGLVVGGSIWYYKHRLAVERHLADTADLAAAQHLREVEAREAADLARAAAYAHQEQQLRHEAAERDRVAEQLRREQLAQEQTRLAEAAQARVAAQMKEEAHWRSTSLDSSRLQPDTVILIARDTTGRPKWEVGARLESRFRQASSNPNAHVLTDDFYRGPYGARLKAGDLPGVLADLGIAGKFRSLVLATLSTRQTAADAQGFITVDLELKFEVYDAFGHRRNEVQIRESGAALDSGRAYENALDRLFLFIATPEKFIQLNL